MGQLQAISDQKEELKPTINVDNKKWVNENKDTLPDPSNVNLVFRTVILSHPLNGCPYHIYPSIDENTSLEFLSTLADAVTVYCVDYVEVENVSKEQVSHLLAGSIGNLAYIAIYATDPRKELALRIVNEWKALHITIK